MATRFYLPGQGLADALVTPDAAWNETADAYVPRRANTMKIGSSILGTPASVSWTTGNTQLMEQFITGTLLGAQTISGTISGMGCYARGTGGSTNVDKIYFGARVVSSDGSTVRGTLLAVGNYFANAALPKRACYRILANAQAITTVNALDGDRIVFELGVSDSSSPIPSAVLVTGDAQSVDSALSEHDDLSYDQNVWIELSANLTISQRPSGFSLFFD